MRTLRLFILLLLFSSTGMAADRYIIIDKPAEHARVDPAQPLLVSGSGRGLFEGNVVVRVEDAAGRQLLQVPTTMKRDHIAAAGEWQVSITLPRPVPGTIRLTAFSPSPKEGDAAISSRSIMLSTQPLSDNQTGLEAPDWRLSRYLDVSGKVIPVLADTAVTARFRDGRVGGSAGCNRYFGGYTVGTEDQLVVSANMGTTMMACVTPVAEQERLYLQHLSAVAAFELEGESLRLLDQDQKALLEYTAVRPLTLEGTPWRAAGINNGRGGVVSTATTALSTAEFTGGKVSGHAGCNTFNASYEITDDRISMGPAMTTRMYCAEPDGIMDQEQEYLAALSRAQVFELTDNGLKLRDENGSLQVNFVAEDKTQ